ncbi:MAG: hypothetical protein ABR968_04080 [Bacteroidales bacterium]|jgi:hypothetical protein
MQHRIIEPVNKQIYQTRLFGGTYYHAEAANRQLTEAKSPVIKPLSRLYTLFISHNKPVPLYIASISGGDDVISALQVSSGLLYNSTVQLHKPLGEFHNSLGRLHDSLGCPNDLLGELHNLLGCPNDLLGELHNLLGCPNDLLGELHNLLGCPIALLGCPITLLGRPITSLKFPITSLDAALLLPCATVVQAVAHYSSNGGGFKAYDAQVALKAPHGALCILLPALTGKHSSPDCRNVNFGFPRFFSNMVFCV